MHSMKWRKPLVVGLALIATALMGTQCPFGLSILGYSDLAAAGVNQYLGEFTPALSEDAGDGWTRHTFDSEGGDGPICVDGTDFAVYSRARNPKKVMVFLQGGGACWQDFYFCTLNADPVPPTANPAASGIWVDSFDTGSEVIDNPLEDWSVVYVPYCDGSVFSGDNELVDPNPVWTLITGGPVRYHRGLRNLSAAMDVAKDEFPHPRRVLLAGSSAGGVGVAGFAPFLARFLYGNFLKLFVFNDAGPVAINLDETAAIQARADDWQFGQFNPASCTECDPLGQATEIIKWRLQEDRGIREGFYSTDGDATDRFFLNVPTQEEYRELIVTEHGLVRAEAPLRYKRFIRSGDDEHTALQLPTFYLGDATVGPITLPLYEWTDRFVNNPLSLGWFDLVEPFVPLP